MEFLFYYAIIMLIPYFVDLEMEFTQRRHLKEEGYVYAVKKTLIEKILREFKRYMSYFVITVTMVSILELLDDKYHRFCKFDIKEMLKRGEIIPIEKNQANIIRLLSHSDEFKQTQTFSELTTDQKIEMLLKELELLYEKKAEETEINLEEINNYSEEVKEELDSEDFSKKLR